jgi:hypothetical protein
LANPLNVTLITSQLLSQSPAWDGAEDLVACRRIFSVFYTAALQLSDRPASQLVASRQDHPSLSSESWTTAVVKGANESSPRWRHALVLGAILLGFTERQPQSLSSSLHSKLESALVTAINLTLQSDHRKDALGQYTLAFVLNYTFELLTANNRARLHHDALLPLLMEAVFSSHEGLENGYWIGGIDQDVIEVVDKKFNWSPRSPTFGAVRMMHDRPLIASLGPMSRVISHCMGNVRDSSLVCSAMDLLTVFSRNVMISWRHNKLSEIDVSEELEFLDRETTENTLPILWRLLRLSLFASVIILEAILGRALVDARISSHRHDPLLATQCLNVLRNLYFISSRFGQTSSSLYGFVNMIAIDMLAHHAEQAENFVYAIRPAETGLIPVHPADRYLDLFFFNTVEHFAPYLSARVNEEVTLAATMPYLVTGGNRLLMESFEAAHSAALSVLVAPQNAEVAARHLPFYLDVVLNCFPGSLSARQFRLAFKTIVKISSPPSPLSLSQPLFASILLEVISERSRFASTSPPLQRASMSQPSSRDIPLSDQAVLIVALIDSLCFIHPTLLQEWLPRTASLVTQVEGAEFQNRCQDLFWEAISNGQMDMERAGLCVAWWNSCGGRDQLVPRNEAPQHAPVMSGALPMQSRL